MENTPLYGVPIYRDDSIGFNALQLAMTRDLDAETRLKEIYRDLGLCFVVTEIGGKSDRDFQEKINRSLLGASLNGGLIEKTPWDVHALLHAAEEAKRGVIVNTASTVNLALKIAILRDDHWIAVAIYGQSSIHPVTCHERCGLGIMHI